MFWFKRKPKFDCQKAVADIRKEMYQNEIEAQCTSLQLQVGDKLIIHKPYCEKDIIMIYVPDPMGKYMVKWKKCSMAFWQPMGIQNVMLYVEWFLFAISNSFHANNNKKEVHKAPKQRHHIIEKYRSKNKGWRNSDHKERDGDF